MGKRAILWTAGVLAIWAVISCTPRDREAPCGATDAARRLKPWYLNGDPDELVPIAIVSGDLETTAAIEDLLNRAEIGVMFPGSVVCNAVVLRADAARAVRSLIREEPKLRREGHGIEVFDIWEE